MELPKLRKRQRTRNTKKRFPNHQVSFLAALAVLGLAALTVGCQPAEPPRTAVKETPQATTNKPAETTQASPPAAKVSVEPARPAAGEAALPSPSEKPAKPEAPAEPPKETPEPTPAASAESTPESNPAPRDLGQPLVDNPQKLARLHPTDPVWFDKEHKSVVVLTEVCQRKVTLEMFACLKGSKEHESILSVPTKAFVIHAGLLAAGAEPGNTVQFYPKYVPASGPEIEITVIWKDEKGKLQRARGQDWVRDFKTQKPMESPWIFAGSQFVKDEQTGQQFYRADGEGDLICVSNFPSAVLDLPIRSSDANAELMFECFTERIPPVGTPVTLVLTPKLDAPKK
jgi:hypothetical protein